MDSNKDAWKKSIFHKLWPTNVYMHKIVAIRRSFWCQTEDEKLNTLPEKFDSRPKGSPPKNKKTPVSVAFRGFLQGGLEGIQTPNLLIRSQMLYSVELRNHDLRLQIYSFF